MGDNVACPHHPGKAYVCVDGRLVCSVDGCDYTAPYQPGKSYAELQARVIQLEKLIQDWCECVEHGTSFTNEAKRVLDHR